MSRRSKRSLWKGWVKVQRSIATSAPSPQVFIYNQDRSLMVEADLDDTTRDAMGDHMKVYMRATLLRSGLLLLDAETTIIEEPW